MKLKATLGYVFLCLGLAGVLIAGISIAFPLMAQTNPHMALILDSLTASSRSSLVNMLNSLFLWLIHNQYLVLSISAAMVMIGFLFLLTDNRKKRPRRPAPVSAPAQEPYTILPDSSYKRPLHEVDNPPSPSVSIEELLPKRIPMDSQQSPAIDEVSAVSFSSSLPLLEPLLPSRLDADTAAVHSNPYRSYGQNAYAPPTNTSTIISNKMVSSPSSNSSPTSPSASGSSAAEKPAATMPSPTSTTLFATASESSTPPKHIPVPDPESTKNFLSPATSFSEPTDSRSDTQVHYLSQRIRSTVRKKDKGPEN